MTSAIKRVKGIRPAGCAVTAPGSDRPRQTKNLRDAFTKRLEENLEVLASLLKARTAACRYDLAIQLFSAMIGALISRASSTTRPCRSGSYKP